MKSKYIMLLFCFIMLLFYGCTQSVKKDLSEENLQLYQEKIVLKKVELKKSWHNFLEEGGKIVTQD